MCNYVNRKKKKTKTEREKELKKTENGMNKRNDQEHNA